MFWQDLCTFIHFVQQPKRNRNCSVVIFQFYLRKCGVKITLRCFLLGRQEAQGPTLQTAKALAMTAIDIFLDQKLASQMKTDFTEDMNNN